MKKRLIILTSILIIPTFISSCSLFTIDETLSSESIKAESNVETTQPAVEIDENSDTFDVPDAMGNTLTVEKKSEVTRDTDEYNNTKYPLIASLPDNSISIYEDKNKGMIYVDDGYAQYFPIGSVMTPVFSYPQLFYSDFDENGDDEAAIIINSAGGTSVYLEDLYIIEEIEQDNLPYFNIIGLTQAEIENTLKKEVNYTKVSENSMKLTVGGTEYDVPTIDNVSELSYGSITFFDIIGTDMRLHIPVGVIQEGTVTAQYENMGEILYSVKYEDDELVLSNPVYVATTIEE